jgi:hypothetical protein
MIQLKFTKGAEDQTESFLSGFNEVVSLELLKYFFDANVNAVC